MKFRLPLFTLATACNIFLSACATLPAHANARINPSWKWRGFEVIGNHQVPMNDIQALIPIRGGLVRNNISKFTLHFTDKLLNETQRLQVIDNLLIQLDRPSFADRKKSIYNLLLIAQKFASDRSYMGAKGESLIRYISQASVLPNVKEPALELLKLIEGTRDSISELINRCLHTSSLSVMRRGAKW